MNGPISANSMIDGVELGHLVGIDPEERADEVDVVATGQLHLEARAEGQQGRDPTVGHDLALARLEDPGQGEQQGALARAVRADDGQRLALVQGEREVLERPEVRLARAVAPEHAGQRALEGRPPGQAQVVADPQVGDLDGGHRPVDGPVGHRRRRHQRILAKAGSTRLKKTIATPSRPIEKSRTSEEPEPVGGGRAPGDGPVGLEQDGERVERQDRVQRRVRLGDRVQRDQRARQVEDQAKGVGHHVLDVAEERVHGREQRCPWRG